MAKMADIWNADGSTRVDRRSGIRERVAFVPRNAGRDQLFIVVHEPPADPVGGVLVCSSILADQLANYQREVHLARHLAAAGFVTVRFHYSGTGNSDGDPAALTLDVLRDDARWVGEAMRDHLGAAALGLIGTRWGAVAAAAVARDAEAGPLVLCEPIVDGRRYFREAMRSRAMSAIATRSGKPGPGLRLADLLDANGCADILGNVIHRPLYDSADGHDLLFDLTRAARPTLLVQFGGTGLRADLLAFEQRLAATGWSIDTATFDLAESWWFRSGPRITRHPDLNEVTADWLLTHLDRAPVAR
ncbi:MAG: serine aminopeptidase domain-containing protein [Acidimicrobiales bacterium]